MAKEDKAAIDLEQMKRTRADQLPILPETTRNNETLQWFYRIVTDCFACQNDRISPLFIRRCERGLAIRFKNSWRIYRKSEQIEFWRDAFIQFPQLQEVNWSTKRMTDLWNYFQIYVPEIIFDNRRYFEMSNAILDGNSGELDYSDYRFLNYPTTRSSDMPYKPDYTPSPAWQKWYDTMDVYQKEVRDWSVGSAVLGEHGLLFTFGQSRTGKSTLAEGLSTVLGSGAGVFSLSRNWGRFYTQHMDNTTYLYDADAKGAKNQNNENYGTLHLMASGDPIQVEVKGGDVYHTDNYGFVEVISNSPATFTFEQSLVDRVRFCLYTYIDPRSDGGRMKKMILADKQAWLNYAVDCAIKFAKGTTSRPVIDEYQIYGWVMWLKEANSYARMCFDSGYAITYTQYHNSCQDPVRYRLTRETVEEIQAGFKELERQYGKSFLDVDWDEFGRKLKERYYGQKRETSELF